MTTIAPIATITPPTQDLLAVSIGVLKAEAEALICAAQRLEGSFESAVELIAAHEGKVLITGVGNRVI